MSTTKSQCLQIMSSLNIHHGNLSIDTLLSVEQFLSRYNFCNHKAFFKTQSSYKISMSPSKSLYNFHSHKDSS